MLFLTVIAIFRFKTDLYRSLGFKPSLELAKRQKENKITKTKISIQSIEQQLYHKPEVENFYARIKAQEKVDGKPSNSFESVKPEKCINIVEQNLSHNDATMCQDRQDFLKTNNDRSVPSKVIIDMSQCSFIDNDGVKTLKSIFKELSKLQIHLILSKCPGMQSIFVLITK